MPLSPGTYVIAFQYGGSPPWAEAEYRVADAKLEADSMASVHDLMFSDHPAEVPPHAVPMYVHVLALRSEGLSYICVQQTAVSRVGTVALKEFIGIGLDVDDPRVHIFAAAPFRRVATNSASVVSLSARADADENLTIDWTDADGKKGHLNYPASYPALARKQNR